jgi:uncharacterized repeat protein (TIGR01451 family)
LAPGGHVRYRIVVRNEGNRGAHDLRVGDDLPAGLAEVNRPGAQLRNGEHGHRAGAGDQPGRLVNVARLAGSNVKVARDGAGVQRVLGERRGGGVTG